MYGETFGAVFGRLRFLSAWIIGSVVALALLGAAPAHAACVQNGANVNCTGTTPGGFGDGTDDNLIVNVVPGATLFGGNPAVTALNLRDGNMVINAGTLSSTGPGGIGLALNDGNLIINNGTIIGGANGYSVFGGGFFGGNIVVNTGTLDGTVALNGFFSSLTNAGLITITNPGTPIGAQHLIAGDFIQTSTGTLALRVDGLGQFDGVFADTAILAGTLRAVVQPGLYGTTTFYPGVVSTFCGCIGNFERIVTSSVFFTGTAAINAFGDGVDLTLTRIPFGNVPGLTDNQRNVGNALERSYSTALVGNLATFYGNLLASSSAGVLDQISGEGTAGTQTAAFSAATMFNSVLMGQGTYWRNGGPDVNGFSYAPVAYAPTFSRDHPAFAALKGGPAEPPRRWRAWAAGFGGTRTLDGDAAVVGSGDLRQRTAGGAVGVEYAFSPNLLVGVGAGGSTSNFSVSNRLTDGTVDAGHIGGYGVARLGGFYAAGVLSYSRFENSTTRTITGIGAAETATARFSSDLLSARVEVGRPHDFGFVTLTPFAAVEVSELWQRAYNETSTAGGAGPGLLGLSFAARSVTSLPIFLGAQLDTRVVFPNGAVWTPFVRASWVHEFYPNREVTASLLGITPWTVAGARAARDSLKVDAGSRVAVTPAVALYANVNGEFAEHGRFYTATGGMRYAW